MGDQSTDSTGMGNNLSALARGLFFMTPIGQRWASASNAYENIQMRKALEDWRRQQEAHQQGQEQELSGMGPYYQDPSRTLTETPSFKYPNTWKEWRALQGQARSEQLGTRLAGALVAPGQPGRADVTDEPPAPTTVPERAPTREVDFSPATPPSYTIPASSETGRPDQTYQAPPWMAESFPRRSPIETGPTSQPAAMGVAESMPGSVQYTPPTGPTQRTFAEAIASMPLGDRGAATAFLAQHPGLTKPVTSEGERTLSAYQKELNAAGDDAEARNRVIEKWYPRSVGGAELRDAQAQKRQVQGAARAKQVIEGNADFRALLQDSNLSGEDKASLQSAADTAMESGDPRDLRDFNRTLREKAARAQRGQEEGLRHQDRQKRLEIAAQRVNTYAVSVDSKVAYNNWHMQGGAARQINWTGAVRVLEQERRDRAKELADPRMAALDPQDPKRLETEAMLRHVESRLAEARAKMMAPPAAPAPAGPAVLGGPPPSGPSPEPGGSAEDRLRQKHPGVRF